MSALREQSFSARVEVPGTCACASRGALPTVPTVAAGRAGMARIPGGEFLMGSDKFYREERPPQRARVSPFWMDVQPVTNAEFQRFVEATGYVTMAERRPQPELYPEIDAALLVPGSLVFNKPPGRVGLGDYRAWWSFVPDACWRHPTGPESSVRGLEDHPVVHVAYEDAARYAAWAGKSLPNEAEWEFAARGGLDAATYPWGDEFAPEGRLMANIWIGRFPWESLKAPGAERTSPVRSFPANGYGLFDVVGNVWEWTTTPFEERPRLQRSPCCTPAASPREQRQVVKGGSHLCAPNYCLRYRPAARQGQTLDTTTSHIGFRCIARDGDERRAGHEESDDVQ